MLETPCQRLIPALHTLAPWAIQQQTELIQFVRGQGKLGQGFFSIDLNFGDVPGVYTEDKFL